MLVKLQELFQDNGLRIVIISQDLTKDRPVFIKKINAQPIALQSCYDPYQHVYSKLGLDLDSAKLPVSFLVDRQGRIRSCVQGYSPEKFIGLIDAVAKLLLEIPGGVQH